MADNKMILECEELMKKYGHMSFEESLPFLQEGWWSIGEKHNLTGPEVLHKYLTWKNQQK